LVRTRTLLAGKRALFAFSLTWSGDGYRCWLCAVVSPEIMGIGYDTVDAVILGQIGVFALLLILLTKIFATALCVGFSIPAGLIGPAIFIGAVAGGIVGKFVEMITSNFSDASLYAMLGMGAMMGGYIASSIGCITCLTRTDRKPEYYLSRNACDCQCKSGCS